MTHKTVFITQRGERHQQDALKAAPNKLSVTMLRQPDSATLRHYLAQAEYLISERAGVIDSALLQAAPHLKLIQRLGSLTYDIDLAAAKGAGIAVCYRPVRGSIQVAEHMVMQMLVVGKRLRRTEQIALEAGPHWGVAKRTDEDTFAYNWSGQTGLDTLWRKTVGILGFGEIGAELARRLRGWDSRILYHKRRRLPLTAESDLGLTYVDQRTLISQSDYLCNLLPYFPEIDTLLDANWLAQMKPESYLLSCGSGSVIDERALAAAIRGGNLAGAALDTFEWEPLRADNPLVALANEGFNILLTPHVAAGGHNASGNYRAGDYENILRHLAGKPLENRLV